MRSRSMWLMVIAVAIALGGTASIPSSSVEAHGDADEKLTEDGQTAQGHASEPEPAGQSRTATLILETPIALREIAVTMTDELRFDPGTVVVMAGETVRFVLDNPTTAPHDFTLGDAEAQARHHDEMAAAVGHGHGADAHADLPGPVLLEPGASAEVVATFDEPGELLIGCHVPGHWEAGMRGTIKVLDAAGLLSWMGTPRTQQDGGSEG